jgi:hypothetical protein
MQIVLPGALPDPREARELTPYLLKAAPTLANWLQYSHAAIKPANPAETGCTPYEQWLLGALGFEPGAGQNLSSGLGPLWLNSSAPSGHIPGPPAKSDQIVWLTELVHVSPSRDGAALLPARELAISADQSVALFESAQRLFEGTGFALHHTGVERWRIDIPKDFAPRCASPLLVSITSVNDWWPQDIAARPWRRLVNELQMLWFENPVNQTRAAQGLAPVNSLWLFGGAAANQFPDKRTRKETKIYDALLAPSLKHDWGAWVDALTELERRVFQPMAQHKNMPEIVLIGRERIIELKPKALGRWTRWLPGGTLTWSKWWSPQN